MAQMMSLFQSYYYQMYTFVIEHSKISFKFVSIFEQNLVGEKGEYNFILKYDQN